MGRVNFTEEYVKAGKQNQRGSINNEILDGNRSTHMSSLDGHRADLRSTWMLKIGQSKDGVDLSAIRALNERCLELMVHLARSEAPPAPPAISANLALWRGLHPSARLRASRYAVLLLDMNFSDAAWWRWAAENRPIDRTPGATGYLPPKLSTQLARETITLAWILARADRGLATVLCGMAPPVTRMFCLFGPLDVERLSARHHRHLRLRFDDQPSYWRMHLTISGSNAVGDASKSRALPESRQQSLF